MKKAKSSRKPVRRPARAKRVTRTAPPRRTARPAARPAARARVAAIPPGFHTVTPHLVVTSAAEAHMALHRPLTPDDTAAVVAMLARDEAEALTGQTLTADGGLVMR